MTAHLLPTLQGYEAEQRAIARAALLVQRCRRLAEHHVHPDHATNEDDRAAAAIMEATNYGLTAVVNAALKWELMSEELCLSSAGAFLANIVAQSAEPDAAMIVFLTQYEMTEAQLIERATPKGQC